MNKKLWICWTVGTVVASIIILIVLVLSFWRAPSQVPFWHFTQWDVLRLLVSLAIVATLVERATEVVISLCRDAGRREREADVVKFKASITDDCADAEAKKQAEAELEKKVVELGKYKSATAVQATALTFLLGLAVSAVGFRSLAPLVDTTVLHDLTDLHRHTFTGVDILITGALIGGGSKGMHSVIEAVIGLFKMWRELQLLGVENKKKKGN
jgi:hypothetical protein